jgi:hypothetical protein
MSQELIDFSAQIDEQFDITDLPEMTLLDYVVNLFD